MTSPATPHLTVGSLFSGIGGIELGLEQTGHFKTIWQVEQDKFCQEVLARHWPDVPRYEDVKTFPPEEGIERPDVICGGFPCQPISQAAARCRRGNGWMWPDYARILGQTKPTYAIIENPQALRYKRRGLGLILKDLAEIGYDAEWRVFGSDAFGAKHKRARLWLVAYTNNKSKSNSALNDEAPILSELCGNVRSWPDSSEYLRMDDGIPGRVVLYRALGNSVVPACARWIGERIARAAGVSE